jgi:hypothetical protein
MLVGIEMGDTVNITLVSGEESKGSTIKTLYYNNIGCQAPTKDKRAILSVWNVQQT